MSKSFATIVVVFLIFMGVGIGLSPAIEKWRTRSYQCNMVGADYSIWNEKCFMGDKEVRIKF